MRKSKGSKPATKADIARLKKEDIKQDKEMMKEHKKVAKKKKKK